MKTAKHCIKRAVGTTKLTFEELTTVCCQAEACMNSRPYIAQDSHDPSGEMPLTSGHFLTGRPMNSYPSVPEEPDMTLTNRWELCKAMSQKFWELWQKQYLQTLQKSPKWHKEIPNLNVGDLIMLLETNCLQTHWKMGKIISVSPGSDGLVRTAEVLIKHAVLPGYCSMTTRPLNPKDITTKSSILRRPVVKLAPLMSTSPSLHEEVSSSGGGCSGLHPHQPT